MCTKHYRRNLKYGDPLTVRNPLHGYLDFDERWEAQVTVHADCWEWTGQRVGAGYGQVYYRGRTQIASRVAWERRNGPVPDGLLVLHHCDNPPCVRPDHLYLGTHKKNSDDKWGRGRGRVPRGEENTNSRLTADAVRDIRANPEVSTQVLADRYGVSKSAVSQARRGVTWQHI